MQKIISVCDAKPSMWPLAQDPHWSLWRVGTGRTIFGRAMDRLYEEGATQVLILTRGRDIEQLAREVPAEMIAEFETVSPGRMPQGDTVMPVEAVLHVPLAFPWDLLQYHLALLKDVVPHDPGLARHIEDFRWSIRGNVHIEEDVFVAASAIVRGPCVLKRGAKIHDRAVVKGSYIGERVTVGTGATVKNSLVYDQAKLRHGAIILHSIIGERCNVGPASTVSDMRLDGRDVESDVQGRMISTGLRHFGIVMGADTVTGTSVSMRAGIKIGERCRLNSGICVTKDIENDTEVDFQMSPLAYKKLDG